MKRLISSGLVLVGMALAGVGCTPGDLRLEEVAGGFDAPVYVTSAPDDASLLYVVEQKTGRVRLIDAGEVVDAPFLDLGDKVYAEGSERGLLGLALHPDFAENGRLFVNYTSEGAGGTVFTVIEEYLANSTKQADPNSGKVILSYQQPAANHNGGMLAFGPDGYLYIASGDGGPGNDPDGRGQALNTFLGKLLRLDVDVDGDEPYAIPADSPFVDVEGAFGEIWAYGLRNPWRFSFDRMTGDLFIGDVGERAREEINFESASSNGGVNYGWSIREGTICRPGRSDCAIDGATDPIYEYDKLITASVTGGYVYRGAAIPDLQGTYLFADFTSGEVWGMRYDGATITDFALRRDLRPPGLLPAIASFGEDADGELYVVEYLSGTIYKIVPRDAAAD